MDKKHTKILSEFGTNFWKLGESVNSSYHEKERYCWHDGPEGNKLFEVPYTNNILYKLFHGDNAICIFNLYRLILIVIADDQSLLISLCIKYMIVLWSVSTYNWWKHSSSYFEIIN
jgi:hypothetical protein